MPILNLFGVSKRGYAPLSFSSPFPSQGKGDTGGWGQIKRDCFATLAMTGGDKGGGLSDKKTFSFSPEF